MTKADILTGRIAEEVLTGRIAVAEEVLTGRIAVAGEVRNHVDLEFDPLSNNAISSKVVAEQLELVKKDIPSVDDSLSETSKNAVMNSVVTAALAQKKNVGADAVISFDEIADMFK